MNGEQINEQNIQPQDSDKPNYLLWVLIIVILAAGAWYLFLRGSDLAKEVEKPIDIIYERIEVLSPEFIDEQVILSVLVIGQEDQEGGNIWCDMEEFEEGRFSCPEPLELFGTFNQEGQEYQIWAADPARYNKETKGHFVASNIFVDGQQVDFQQEGKYEYGFFGLK